MTAFGVVLTAVVLVAIAVAILLFERQRAEQIEHDLREQAGVRSTRPAPGERPARRRFPTRWAVTAFVVLALVVCIAVMLWQARGEPPDQTDVGLGQPGVVVPDGDVVSGADQEQERQVRDARQEAPGRSTPTG